MAAPLPALSGAAGPLPWAVLSDVVSYLRTTGILPPVEVLFCIMFVCFRRTAHLFEFLIGETVELDDELAVRGRDLSAGVDYLDDIQLLSQTHLCADLPTQVFDVLHLKK